MCIRDRVHQTVIGFPGVSVAGREPQAACDAMEVGVHHQGCLLYTSDAADERSSVDLGGRRIIKKKTNDDEKGKL